MATSKDLFDHATWGDVDFFKGVPVDVFLSSRGDDDDSVLSRAAKENQLECCEEICKICPSLLYLQNYYGNTPLHVAALKDRSRVARFLLNIATNMEKEDIEGRIGENKTSKKLLTMTSHSGDTALHLAVRFHHLETTRFLIEADHNQKLLRIVNLGKDTALHDAVRNQNLEMVKLLTDRQPDFDYCANLAGETPLMSAMRLASRYGNNTDVNSSAVKIRKLLLQKHPSQSKLCTSENRWTSLHHAASTGDLSAIQDIIQFCPDCLELVDRRGQNFLHIAAKEHVEVVKNILGAEQVPLGVLNEQDNNGNTPLHTAALSGNASTTLCLLYDPRVDKMTVNAKGQKVLDAITFDYDKEKAGVYGVRDSMNEKQLKDQSDFNLVVGVLIATVSFTAGIAVPGGYISEGQNAGMAVLSKKLSFQAFVLSNNFALVLSLYAVFSQFCTRRLLKKKDITYQLNVATFCTLGAIFAMMLAFIAGSYTVLSISNRLVIAVCVNCCFFFIFAFRAILRIVMQHRPSAQ